MLPMIEKGLATQRILGITSVILIMTYVMTGISKKRSFAPNLSLLPVMHTSSRRK